jgi:hypothetical protein
MFLKKSERLYTKQVNNGVVNWIIVLICTKCDYMLNALQGVCVCLCVCVCVSFNHNRDFFFSENPDMRKYAELSQT